MNSQQTISEIRRVLVNAEEEGLIGDFLLPPYSKPLEKLDNKLAREWCEFFSEIGGFDLTNSGQEFYFGQRFKTVNFLMPNRIDLSDESTKWGWFCKVSSDGQPGSVWYLSDCFCHYGYPNLELWVKGVLENHRLWMDIWRQNGSPDRELEEERWEKALAAFDPQSLELNILKQKHPTKTIVHRDEMLDFRQAKFGEYLDLRWNLSADETDDLYYRKRHSLRQKLKLFFFS